MTSFYVFSITDVLKLKGIRTVGGNGLSSQLMFGFSLQIALLHILKEIGVNPDYVRGVSHGRLIAAYSNRTLTLEETILSLHILAEEIENSAQNGIGKRSTFWEKVS